MTGAASEGKEALHGSPGEDDLSVLMDVKGATPTQKEKQKQLPSATEADPQWTDRVTQTDGS